MLQYQKANKQKNSKDYDPNCFKEIFTIKKVKNTVPWTYWRRNYYSFLQKRVTQAKLNEI